MKLTLLALAFLSLSATAQAGTQSLSTLVSCSRHVGSQLTLEIGIVAEKQALKAYVVETDEAAKTSRLVVARKVAETAVGATTVYVDAKETLGLFVKRKGHVLKADAIVVDTGSKAYSEKSLGCSTRSSISFDRQ